MPYPRQTAHNSFRRTPSPTPSPLRALTAAPLALYDFPSPSVDTANEHNAASINQNATGHTATLRPQQAVPSLNAFTQLYQPVSDGSASDPQTTETSPCGTCPKPFNDMYTVNMKCSWKRYKNFRDHLLRLSADYKASKKSEARRPPAIICVQDPPPHIAYHKISGYRCEFHIRQHLKPADYPFLYGLSGQLTHLDKKKAKRAAKAAQVHQVTLSTIDLGVRRANESAVSQLSEESTALSFKRLADLMGLRQVAFFIRDDVPKRDTRVIPHRGFNEPYAATLEVDTQLGTLCMHNMYNHEKKINIAELKEQCMQSDNDMLVGDSNLHHKLWGGNIVAVAASTDALSSQLAAALQETGMQTCLSPGTITYAPGLRTTSARKTSIDIVFSSTCLRPRIHDCAPIEVRGYESDHAVIRMSIDLEPSSAPPRARKLYEEIDHAFKQDLITRIKSFVRRPSDLVVEYGAHVVQCIAGAEELVPTQRTIARVKPPTPEHFAQKLEIERKALLALERRPTTENVKRFEEARRDLDKDIAAESRKSFRDGVDRSSEKLRWRHYTWARHAQTWNQPQQAPTMPVLQVGDKTFMTIEEKANLYAHTIWPEVRNHTDGDASSPTLPHFHPREQLSCNQFVTEKEVLGTIKDLSDHKAPGSDRISNELLKTCAKELAPILADFFTDMFIQSVHLKEFKHAITTLLLKSGKHPALPKSYRPVALLSCLGKVFEKLIANRFRYLAETHNLLPNLQFGAPGRDTTKALQAILSPVYTGWCTKQKTTILSLDITGAFDRVNRAKLLQILVDKGIPDWLVRLTASFLSERSTTLNMLGTMSEPFWVDIGIPQGSPLSPILFLFSAGDLHSLFGKKDYILSNAKVHCFAYVDDTYLMVTSPTYEKNIEILEDMHAKVLRWAEDNGYEFGAHKYSLMHFRSHHKAPVCTLLPNNIPNFGEGRDVTDPVLRTDTEPMNILGVLVGPRLRWDQHITAIEEKVGHKLRALLRITGSTWGRSLHDMRELYRTTIIPIITYGCGAWYVNVTGERSKWNIPKCLVKRLQDLQYSCLMQMSGAFHKTGRKILEKELFIDPIQVTLARLSIAHRVRCYYDDVSAHCRLAQLERHRREQVKDHPYQILDREACSVERAALAFLCQRKSNEQAERDWANRDKRGRAIKVYLQQWASCQSQYIWDEYRNSRLLRGKRVCPALDSDFHAEWDDRSLACYKGLTRPQSTMLLHIRTSFIGLNSHLYSINCSGTEYCPCLRERQTAKHLLLDCTLLSEQRGALVNAIGHLNLPDMLTKDAFETTRWAVMHFGIPQWHLAKTDAQRWKAPERKEKKKKKKKKKRRPSQGAGGHC